MDKNDMDDLSGSRDGLEDPGYLLVSSDESYRMLLAALDLGWKVQEPVYFRPRWHEGDEWVFHFIIEKNSMNPPRLITIRHGLAVVRLVLSEGWRVDRYPVQVEPFPLMKEGVKKSIYISDLLHSQLPS
jgi:hypothetical protein